MGFCIIKTYRKIDLVTRSSDHLIYCGTTCVKDHYYFQSSLRGNIYTTTVSLTFDNSSPEPWDLVV